MPETGMGMKIPDRSVVEGSLSVNSDHDSRRLHLHGFGAEAAQPAQAILVPSRRRRTMGRRRSCCGRSCPMRMRLSSLPKAPSMSGGCFGCSNAFALLAAAWLRRQAGNEEEGTGRHSDVRTRPEPRLAKSRPSSGRGGSQCGRAPSPPFPHGLGVPGKVPGPFQGERDIHAVAEILVIFPAAARISLPSAVPIQEGRQRHFATASQPHNSSPGVPRPEQPSAETPRQAETREGLHKEPGRFRARACRWYLPCSMPTRLC